MNLRIPGAGRRKAKQEIVSLAGCDELLIGSDRRL
jgi:hypothetical protein